MQMLKIQKYILTISILTACTIKTAEPVNGDNPQDHFLDRAFFKITNTYNQITQPADQKFHSILDKIDGATREKPIIKVKTDTDGKLKILGMDDGIGSLFLGTMPSSYALSWSDSLKGKYTNQYEQIRNYTKRLNAHIININFNTKYEKDQTGLNKLATNDGHVTVHQFETTDTYAPSPEKLLDMISKIKTRKDDDIVYVNCKAGKGRSATGVFAYCIDLFERAEIQNSDGGVLNKSIFNQENIFNAIESRLKEKRPVVNINNKQMSILKKVFDEICKKNSNENNNNSIATTNATPMNQDTTSTQDNNQLDTKNTTDITSSSNLKSTKPKKRNYTNCRPKQNFLKNKKSQIFKYKFKNAQLRYENKQLRYENTQRQYKNPLVEYENIQLEEMANINQKSESSKRGLFGWLWWLLNY